MMTKAIKTTMTIGIAMNLMTAFATPMVVDTNR